MGLVIFVNVGKSTTKQLKEYNFASKYFDKKNNILSSKDANFNKPFTKPTYENFMFPFNKI